MDLVKQIEDALEFAYLAKAYADKSVELKLKSIECEEKSKSLLSDVVANNQDTIEPLPNVKFTNQSNDNISVYQIKYPEPRKSSGTTSTTLEYVLNPCGKSHV